MSQPDPARTAVPRARPSGSAPLRVVSERVEPDDLPACADAGHGPAQLRAGFQRVASTPAPLAVARCPEPWPAPSSAGPSSAGPSSAGPSSAGPDGPGVDGPASAPQPVRLAVVPPGAAAVAEPWSAGLSHVAMSPPPVRPEALAAPTADGVSAELVPARSLLPVPSSPRSRRPLLARLIDALAGRRDPTAGRHRPDSIASPTWSMCDQRRRRSWRRGR